MKQIEKEKIPVVKILNVNKRYIISHEKPILIDNLYKNKKEIFKAIDNLNFTIYKGEQIGITGPNGAGKTTLLKLISGITTPTTGKIEINGKISTLISVNAGFHNDLTGEENIYLQGLIMGSSIDYLKKNLKKIIKFAGLKQFIDVPISTYSNGMKLRLGFSIAFCLNPDILLIDEEIGFADAEFEKVIEASLYKLIHQNKTLIISGQNVEILKKYATKIIHFENGTIKKFYEVKR